MIYSWYVKLWQGQNFDELQEKSKLIIMHCAPLAGKSNMIFNQSLTAQRFITPACSMCTLSLVCVILGQMPRPISWLMDMVFRTVYYLCDFHTRIPSLISVVLLLAGAVDSHQLLYLSVGQACRQYES